MSILTKIKEALGPKVSAEQIERMLEEAKIEAARERVAARKAYEEMRNEVVAEAVARAQALAETMQQFKRDAFEVVDGMAEKMRQYGDMKETNRGTFTLLRTLENGDQEKVEVQTHRTGAFDERADMAADKVVQFLHERINDEALYELVNDLLAKRNGEFDPRNIQKLYQYEDSFESELYSEAMALFREAYQLTETARYIRFYTRKKGEQWDAVNLNFSAM